MAISLVIIGLLSASAMSLYKPTQQLRNKIATQAILVRVSNAIVDFAVSNHRLPCPDTSGDGHENCTGGAVTGAVAFNTILFELGTSISNSDREELNLVYGVYRNTTAGIAIDNADLAVLIERTEDELGMDSYLNKDDFVQALRNAVVIATSSSYPFVTGDGIHSGNEDCSSNTVVNPAFIIASAGGENRSGSGSDFDGVNEGLSQTGTGSTCFAAVSRKEDANYDDGVIEMDFNSLLSHVINKY